MKEGKEKRMIHENGEKGNKDRMESHRKLPIFWIRVHNVGRADLASRKKLLRITTPRKMPFLDPVCDGVCVHS